METKFTKFADVKFEPVENDAELKFSGYGSVFGNRDDRNDVIVKGAFAHIVKSGPMPLMLLNHEAKSLPIGLWTSIAEDDFGLRLEGRFLDTSAGRDAYVAAKAGAISGLSVGFMPVENGYIKGRTRDDPRYTFTKCDLFEVSIVTYPSNGLARVTQVKSQMDQIAEIESLKALIDDRDAEIKSLEDKYGQAEFDAAAHKLLLKLLGAR